MPLNTLTIADSVPSLVEALTPLARLDPVGVDVERADWQRYYRAAALIQVGGDGEVAVVDPLACADLSALHEFLTERVTVLHAMENDLPPLQAAGIRPPAVEDTSLAAAVLGLPTGLESLLREILDIELDGDKQAMQRADWEARPLSPQMLSYAAGDVADLPALWEILEQRLDDTGRHHWYRQELEAARAQPSVEERRDWTRTKGAGKLDSRAQARLRALWDAREDLARDTDTAPGRIIADKILLEWAAQPPRGPADLGRRGMRRQAVREFGEALMVALAEAETAPLAAPRRSRAPTDADRAAVDKLRTLRAERAAELGIEPGILCPSRTLMTAVLSEPATPEDLRSALGMRPWQWEVVREDFCEVLDVGDSGTAGNGS